ncbi:MAG: putative transcriptional regulator [Acidobacteria bacterium OLB17]|nr:MAG: putative transcriptional regulator [Acidobacteria bacterium OLB17]MCZ2389785.1 MerR family DNA-binding protein [Acidobacteriota bacterium]
MFTASNLAKAAKVPLFTVRYYTRIGLLKPAKNSMNGYKIYSDADRDRLRFIASAKELGFTLAEIEEILGHSTSGDSPCPMVRTIVERRIEENRQKIAELCRLQKRLETAAEMWKGLQNAAPDGHTVCRLIETFAESAK